ncbi:MAG TPA: CHAP domain-containing protein [Myxococcaceae bacterium]|nr:CHAP domain-containing protein [Myxococcaceae bacterium]
MPRRLAAFALFVTAGCVTTAAEQRDAETLAGTKADGPPSTPDEWAPFPRPNPTGAFLADWASRLRGLSSLRQLTHAVPDECTGFVRLAYWQVGVELLGPEALARDNGVTAIYRHAAALGALHVGVPRPGDLVFFVETYDRNHDGLRNDGLTHVGIVKSVEPDGTVLFVHRVSGGVKESRLNLHHPRQMEGPQGERWNDIIRGASRRDRAYLTGELFAAYAGADRLVSTTGGSTLTARP